MASLKKERYRYYVYIQATSIMIIGLVLQIQFPK